MNEAPSCLLVQRGNSYGLFDVSLFCGPPYCEYPLTPSQFADLNTVLLLVLIAALPEAPSALDDRAREIVVCLKKKIRLGVGMVCGESVCKLVCTIVPVLTLCSRHFSKEPLHTISTRHTIATYLALVRFRCPPGGHYI